MSTELVKRARRVLIAYGWQNPFFLIPSARVSIRQSDHVLTAAVTEDGIVFLNPKFCDPLDDKGLLFVMLHELLHLLLVHFKRIAGREHHRWNRATDRAINQTLVVMGHKPIDGSLLPLLQQYRDYTSEEHYEVEPRTEGGGGGGGGGSGPGAIQPGAGCGVEPAHDPNQGEGEAPTSEDKTQEQIAASWREAAVQAKNIARQAGDKHGDILARLLEVPPSRVKWSQILRGAMARAIAEHGHDDVSFRRINRRSHDSAFILPGGITYRARVAIIIDTSGSVSDESLAQAVSEVVTISNAVSVSVFLVTHDAAVQFSGWIRPNVRASAVKDKLRGRGGTMFTDAYRTVERVGSRFDGMVHLTDGEPCEKWPEKPVNVRKLVVALLGCKSRHAIPEGAIVVEAEL